MSTWMDASEEELHKQRTVDLLVFFGTLQFWIETLESYEEFKDKRHAEPERLAAYRTRKDEVRAIIAHGAPGRPAI